MDLRSAAAKKGQKEKLGTPAADTTKSPKQTTLHALHQGPGQLETAEGQAEQLWSRMKTACQRGQADLKKRQALMLVIEEMARELEQFEKAGRSRWDQEVLSSVGEKLLKIVNADFHSSLISAMEIPGFTGTHLDGGDLLATQMAPGDQGKVLIAGVAAQAEDQGRSLNRSEAARRRWRRKRLKQAMSGR